MKTKLALALAAMSTSAMSQTGGMTIYGTLDLGVRSARGLSLNNAPAAGSVRGLVSGVNSTSRLGLRGSEDLGGGLSASFNFESGVSVDTGEFINASKYFDRASWVGLGGRWGRVTAGRQTSLLADTVALTDPLAVRLASFNPSVAITGLSAHGLGAEFGPTASTAGSYRLDSSLKYAGRIGPLTGSLMVASGNVPSSDQARSSKGAGLQYVTDTFTVAGAYQTFRASDDRQLGGWALGATYRVGALKLAGLWGDHKADTSATRQTRQRVSSLGLTWSVTPSVDLIAAYYRMARSRTGRVDDGFERVIAFAEYKLSRRSKLFLEVDATRWRGGYQGVGVVAQARGFTVGASHSF